MTNWLKVLLNLVLCLFSYLLSVCIIQKATVLTILFAFLFVACIVFDLIMVKKSNLYIQVNRNRMNFKTLFELFMYVFLPHIMLSLLLLIISFINRNSVILSSGGASIWFALLTFTLMIIELSLFDINKICFGKVKNNDYDF